MVLIVSISDLCPLSYSENNKDGVQRALNMARPSDLELHCFQNIAIRFSRTKVKYAF